jgi:septin family protein
VKEDLKIKGVPSSEQKSKETTTTPPSISAPPSTPQVQKVDEALKVFYQKYPYEVLKTNPPKECDKGQLEAYLTDEDFEKVFKMTRQKYYEQPKWKQLRQKKEVGLF